MESVQVMLLTFTKYYYEKDIRSGKLNLKRACNFHIGKALSAGVGQE